MGAGTPSSDFKAQCLALMLTLMDILFIGLFLLFYL